MSKEDHGQEENIRQTNEEPVSKPNKKQSGGFLNVLITMLSIIVLIAIIGLAGYLILTSSKVSSFLEAKGIHLNLLENTPFSNKSENEKLDIADVSVVTASTLDTESITYESDTQPIYKMYNTATGETFFSGNQVEIDAYMETDDWEMQGTAWAAPVTSATPVYRLLNQTSYEHYYTMNQEEVAQLTAEGWMDEGICWYSDDAQGKPMYRQYNPYAGSGAYYYSADADEITQYLNAGWEDQGIAWYCPAEENTAVEVKELPINEETEASSDENSNLVMVKTEQNADGTYGYIMVGVDGNSTLVQDLTATSLAAFAVDLNANDHYKNVIVIAGIDDMNTNVYLFAYDDQTVITVGSVLAGGGGLSLASLDGKGGFTTYRYGDSMLNEQYYFAYQCRNYIGDLKIYEDKSPQIGLFNFGGGIVLSTENQYATMNDDAFVPEIEGSMAISTQLFDAPNGNQIAMISAGSPVTVTAYTTLTEASGESQFYFVKAENSMGWVRANDNLLAGMTKIG